MSLLSVNAGVSAETGSQIGQSYSAETVSDLTNRETHTILQGAESTFIFTPVASGAGSILVVRYYALVDPGTGDQTTQATWGYTSDPTGSAHEHQLLLGETHIVRLNPAKNIGQIYIACAAGTTDIYVESQVWDQ